MKSGWFLAVLEIPTELISLPGSCAKYSSQILGQVKGRSILSGSK